MNTKLAYDLPVRIFHFSFAVLFVFSYFVADVIDDESSLYAYHMLSGILMSILVVLRVIWGFIGTKYARFSTFMLKPKDLIGYLKSTVSGKTKRYMGHNPASSFAAIAMFLASIVLVITGVLMSKSIYKDFFEEVHELVANGFLIIVLLHIAGVIFHQLRHKDNIGLSIINGKKQSVEGEVEIKSQATTVGIIFIAIIISSASYILSSYNTNTQILSLPSFELQLGENDDEHEIKSHKKHDEDHDDDHHKDKDDD